MAEGRGDGRRRNSSNYGSRYAPRGSSITVVGKYLSPLCLRSLGRTVAETPCQRNRHLRALCRRYRRRFRVRGRGQTFSCRYAATAGAVCSVVTPGQDSLDRIRSFCGRGSGKAGTWQTGDIQLPRIHPHLWTLQTRQIPASTENPPRPDAHQVAGNQRGVATTDAPVHTRAGEMATPSSNRLLCVPCGSNQHKKHKRIPTLYRQSLAASAQTSKPKGSHDMATNCAD